jgi:hypothetical protein
MKLASQATGNVVIAEHGIRNMIRCSLHLMLIALIRPTFSSARVSIPRRAIPPTHFIAALASARTMSTLSDVIMHDHRELEEYYDNILKASSPDEKVRWQNQFTWELARHSVGEEIVVYPVLQKQVSGGQQLADRDRAEHAKVSPQCGCIPRRSIGVCRGAHTTCSHDALSPRSFSRSSRT